MAQNRAACISNVDDEKWKFQYEVLYSALGTRLLPSQSPRRAPVQGRLLWNRFQGPSCMF